VRRGSGVILDVVPNHMAASEDGNPFWRDLLMRAKFLDLDWRTGVSRRFSDIGELAGVRMEDPEVFETLSRQVIELARDGAIDGVRMDHPDGLANPAQYLRRFREAGIEHVWVEKILEAGEQLRDWPVEGTTGYEFANDVTALLADPAPVRREGAQGGQAELELARAGRALRAARPRVRLVAARRGGAVVRRLAPIGEQTALAQTMLKLTSARVPDIYQGDELESPNWSTRIIDARWIGTPAGALLLTRPRSSG
jgi:maltooligosyltrehalose synthase